jgi:hypothetical protein
LFFSSVYNPSANESSVSSFIASSSHTRLPPLSIGPLPPSSDYAFLSSTQFVLNLDGISTISFVYSYDPASHALVYKPVAWKVHPVIAPLDEEFHITCTLPDDLIARLVPLPSHPPDFVAGEHFTQECADSLDLDPANWLWLDEVKLIRWIVHKHAKAFAWVSNERGRLNE